MRKTSLFHRIAIVLFVAAALLGVSPSTAQVAVSLPDDAGRVGTSDTIPITVADLTGRNVISFEFTVSYDESIMELTGVTAAGTISAGGTPVFNTDTPGQISVSYARTDALSGSGILIQLNATYEALGSSALTFEAFQFNEGDPAAATSDGSITVAERAIEIGDDFTGSVGETGVVIPVTVDELTAADDVISFEFDVNYDPNVLTITGADAEGTLSEGFTVDTNELAPGQVRVVAAGTQAIVGEGTLINLLADIVGSGNSTLTFTNILFNEGTPVLGGISGLIVVAPSEAFVANLTGYNEVQPVDTDATGSVTANYDNGQLVVTGSFSGLSANYTASHIHLAAAGVNGGVIIPLDPDIDADQRGGTFAASSNTFALSAEHLEALRDGRLYVNVHTTANPGGAIRGQLLTSPNTAPGAVSLTEPAEGTDVTVAGDPSQSVTLSWDASTDPDGDRVVYVVQWSGSADFADAGSLLVGMETTAEVSFPALEAALVAAGVGLDETGTIYLRVNAQDGSLRAVGPSVAIDVTRGLLPRFAGNLAGMNEPAMVFTSGSGTVSASITQAEIIVFGSFDGLIGTFTAAHIHAAAPGVNGPIVVPLVVSQDADGRGGDFLQAENTFDAATFDFPAGWDAASFLEAAEAEETYVNVHTTAHPGGELRAQLKLRPNDAPPATTITSPAAAANFNVGGDKNATLVTVEWAEAATSEPIAYVYQISATSNFNNVVWSRTTTETSIDISVRVGLELLEEHAGAASQVTLYHRVITTDGSLWTTGGSSSVVLIRSESGDSHVGVEDGELPDVFALKGNYPNPFNPSTTIRFDLPVKADVRVTIVDMLGREVLSVPPRTVQAGADQSLQVDAGSLPSGTYLYHVIAISGRETMKATGTMTVVK